MPSILARRVIDRVVPGILAVLLTMTAVLIPEGAVAAPADPDHDGLTTRFEQTRTHTSPWRADTDRDGLPDGREDPDHDHLTNVWEMRLGLDPRDRDTDNDGIRDDREDPDHDRLRNAFEIRYAGTDPRFADSDLDGIRDGAEDPDHDGLSNAGEQKFRTDPTDADTDGDLTTDWAEDSDADGQADGLTQDDRPVPSDLLPRLADPMDRPAAHSACQQRPTQASVRICIRGRTGKKVVLFGDSHALQWRTPLEHVAKERGWRLWFITKSACPIARMSIGQASCATWRTDALRAIARIHPDLVIASTLDAYSSVAAANEADNAGLWRTGMTSTLRSLRHSARRVVLLGDTPRWEDPSCLAAHRNDISRCSVRRADAIKSDRMANNDAAAAAAGVSYRRTVDLTCPYDPCPAVIDRMLVTYDGGHMTNAFARSIWRGLARLLPRV